jgi:putative DNA primase/helicase
LNAKHGTPRKQRDAQSEWDRHPVPHTSTWRSLYLIAETDSPGCRSTIAAAGFNDCGSVEPYVPAAVDVHNVPPIAAWPHTTAKGAPLGTIPNTRRLLDNYRINVRYDVIRKDLVATYPGQRGVRDNVKTKAMDTVLSLAALNKLPPTNIPSFVLSIADDNAFNPVTTFITSKPWDGRSRLVDLMDTVQTAEGFDRSLFSMLLRKWLISAVAAAATPSGFWSKGVLVFQGGQSHGKTSWFRALLPTELRDLVKVDAQIDPANKDTIISAVSHWLVELGELDGTLRKADIARLKGFISQDVDQFRRPYGRGEEKFQRRTVFFASVNPKQFLVDDTGNGRWWTIAVTDVDYAHGIDMQQLWAEVFTWFEAGEHWWLTRDEEQRLESSNEDHQQGEPIAEMIETKYSSGDATRALTATEVLVEIGYKLPTKQQLNAAGAALKEKFGDWKKSNGRKVYRVPHLREPYKSIALSATWGVPGP